MLASAVPPPPPPPDPVDPPAAGEACEHSTGVRRIDTRQVARLEADISLADFFMWRRRWETFVDLNCVESYSVKQQKAALIDTMSVKMSHSIEVNCGLKTRDPGVTWQVILDKLTWQGHLGQASGVPQGSTQRTVGLCAVHQPEPGCAGVHR